MLICRANTEDNYATSSFSVIGGSNCRLLNCVLAGYDYQRFLRFTCRRPLLLLLRCLHCCLLISLLDQTYFLDQTILLCKAYKHVAFLVHVLRNKKWPVGDFLFQDRNNLTITNQSGLETLVFSSMVLTKHNKTTFRIYFK